MDQQLAIVPFGANPAREPVSNKERATRFVWNDRKLDALPTGSARRRVINLLFADHGLYSL